MIALPAWHIVQNVATPHTAKTLSTGLNGGLASFMNKAGSGKWDWFSTSVIMVIGAHKLPKTLMPTLTLMRRDGSTVKTFPAPQPIQSHGIRFTMVAR